MNSEDILPTFVTGISTVIAYYIADMAIALVREDVHIAVPVFIAGIGGGIVAQIMNSAMGKGKKK